MGRNCQGTTTSDEFPPELRCFASTLQFYSTKAYSYVRDTFLNALPHTATIRKWFANLDGGPGFSTQSFELLQGKVKEMRKKGQETIIAVMMDDMSLRRQIDYDEKNSHLIGYVDIGAGK